MQTQSIVSMMLCNRPRSVGGRFWISASDSVWEPAAEVPEGFRRFLTDEIGNPEPNYFGSLQMIDSGLLLLLQSSEIFSCFRSVARNDLESINVVPNDEVYHQIENELKFIGWDICTGNGWLAASCHGIFPIDPFSGLEIDSNASMINQFGLFADYNNCLVYIDLNNQKIPEHAPWFPVGVFLTDKGFRRLTDS
jgi:hypothetical protein